MSDDLVIFVPESNGSSEPWGKANDKRGTAIDSNGVSYTEHAAEFVDAHPVNTTLSGETLDDWMQSRGLLTVPSSEASKNSDAWLGHLQRRHIIRGRLNKAANHPRMREGSTPFVLAAIRGGFEVRSPQAAFMKGELPRKIRTLTETKRRQLAELMQSADWSQLPVHERRIAETIYDDIEYYAVDTKTGADRISQKLSKLEHRIRQAIKSGELVPTNHALQYLVDPPSDDNGD